MNLPAINVRDEGACYKALVKLLHPQGLACPRCGKREGWCVHRRCRAPVLDYRCPDCRSIFNAWSGTILCNTHLPPSILWKLVKSIVQGKKLLTAAKTTSLSRPTLIAWRRRLWQFFQELTTHGATDEIGFHAVENRHYVTDIHATVLHQLGLDPRRLEVPGRKRLEMDFGEPIREVLA